MPEIVSQFFLWGGLLAFVQWWRQGSAATAVLAAFALGIAGLTRVELFVLLPCAVTLFLALSDRRPGTRAFLLVYGTLVAHGFVHLVLVPSHYGGVLRLALLGSGRLVLGLGALASLLVLATVTASERFTRRTRRALAALAVAGGAAAFAAGSHAAPLVSVEWLAGTTSWAVLAAAAFGLVLWGRNLKTVGFPLVVFLVAGVPLLYDAHVTEVQLWAVRRFVPVVIPFVCLLAATTIAWSTRLRGGALLGGSLAALLLVGNARPLWRVRSLPFHPAQAEALAALARQVPENAVVFFAPELAAYLIHVPLWLVHDREPLVLPLFGWETVLARTAPGLSRRHPVLYVGNAFGGPPRVDGLAFQPRAEIRLETLVPALDVRRAPTAGVTHLIPLRLYDVSRREAG
jgi:MFS family permease